MHILPHWTHPNMKKERKFQFGFIRRVILLSCSLMENLLEERVRERNGMKCNVNGWFLGKKVNCWL